MEFQKDLKHKTELVEQALAQTFNEINDVPEAIVDAMRYSVFAGGKRIRPILLLASYELFSNDIKSALPFACALEMIHTYSLIHDDLPAMDNSDLRRGRKTNHIVFGEAMAVLAGDALLNYAFEIMLSAPSHDTARVMRAAAYIAKSAGICGMIGGQVLDIQGENCIMGGAELMRLHEKKTGALMRASVCSGAILGRASDTQISSLELYARHLGLAFQIMDDILDVTGDKNALGKPTGSDSASNKNTYVSLYGLSRAKEMLISHTKQANEAIAPFGSSAEFLHDLTEYLLYRNK